MPGTGDEHTRCLWKMPGGVAVPTRAEEYRAKAQECAQRAKAARDPEAKRAYEDLARQWLDMAKRADEGGGRPVFRKPSESSK